MDMRAHVVCLGLLVFAVLGCGSDKPEAKGGSTLKKLETKDIKVGTVPAAKTGDWVWVRYTGKLADGTEFDSNATGKPLYAFQLGAGSVIQGWDKGVIGMKEGGKRKLSIPPDLAYGPEGSGGKVPPNADLFFDVELFKVLPKDKLKEVSVKILEEGTG